MSDTVIAYVRAFGISAILAILCSGCAVGPPPAQAMTIRELGMFIPDCRIAQQQIAMLNGMRRTKDDMLFSVSGWTGEDRMINYLINKHIIYLKEYC